MKILLPWLIKIAVILVVLYLINIPIFQWIDTMFYGSAEAGEQARRENARDIAEVRAADEGNVFRQAESLVSGQGFYRSEYSGQTQPAEIVKGAAFLVQFLVVAWLYFKIFH